MLSIFTRGRQIVLCLPFLFFQNVLHAQLTVTYRVEHLLDTTNIKSRINYVADLIIRNTESLFISENQLYNDTVQIDILSPGQSNPQIRATESPYRRITVLESMRLYKNIKEASTKEIYKIGLSNYMLLDTVKQTDWKISNERRVIGSYNCRRAVTNFKGRKWQIWFTDEIPVTNGPWKFQGLPGLILDAVDEKNQIHFSFIKITQSATAFAIPKRNVKTLSRAQFARVYKEYANDPLKFIAGTAGINLKDSDGDVIYTSGVRGEIRRLKIPNNPIEPF